MPPLRLSFEVNTEAPTIPDFDDIRVGDIFLNGDGAPFIVIAISYPKLDVCFLRTGVIKSETRNNWSTLFYCNYKNARLKVENNP